MKTCSTDGCERKHHARGFCALHYNKAKKLGKFKNPPEKRRSHSLEFLESISGTEVTECIEWPFFKNKGGYGMLKYHGRATVAHRVSLMLHSGLVPKDRYTHCCHKRHCKSKSCVNPNHLYWGTPKENINDAKYLKGGVNISSKLTREQILEIRESSSENKDLCKKYNICKRTVYNIKNRVTHKDLE